MGHTIEPNQLWSSIEVFEHFEIKLEPKFQKISIKISDVLNTRNSNKFKLSSTQPIFASKNLLKFLNLWFTKIDIYIYIFSKCNGISKNSKCFLSTVNYLLIVRVYLKMKIELELWLLSWPQIVICPLTHPQMTKSRWKTHHLFDFKNYFLDFKNHLAQLSMAPRMKRSINADDFYM